MSVYDVYHCARMHFLRWQQWPQGCRLTAWFELGVETELLQQFCSTVEKKHKWGPAFCRHIDFWKIKALKKPARCHIVAFNMSILNGIKLRSDISSGLLYRNGMCFSSGLIRFTSGLIRLVSCRYLVAVNLWWWNSISFDLAQNAKDRVSIFKMFRVNTP